ncbi:MAG TPA: phosphoglycerate dehydrogenase [Bdellovibrionales bacterium]|nr:phosphoglycerate dehydrogenase [Pseudobdellovibrionaceae bacterium]HAG90873.1 phosphoglycerate dehydrogenase [Bdellovibrionales bacterium]|tara:strand:- start:1731 stop:2684 length:954 start_codon:yes stop_codon:yes gene_type:complete
MKTLVLEAHSPKSFSVLKANSEIQMIEKNQSSECEALMIRSHTKVHQKFLKDHPNLKFVVTATSGFDHIDIEACREKNILVSYCPEANAQSTAEHTLFLMLSLLRGANQQYRSLRGGMWREGVERGGLLSERTVGLVGFGRVGKKVAQLCKAFGAQVLAHDPYESDENFKAFGVERKGFTEVLKASDLLSFHVPLTSETKHMINGSTLSELSDEAYIINASRGDVIEESDLVSALREHKIKGAALDVYKKEPLAPNSFLLKEPTLFLTPHTGAYTEEAWERASMEAASKLVAFAKGEVVSDQLPLSTPWFKKSLFPT